MDHLQRVEPNLSKLCDLNKLKELQDLTYFQWRHETIVFTLLLDRLNLTPYLDVAYMKASTNCMWSVYNLGVLVLSS